MQTSTIEVTSAPEVTRITLNRPPLNILTIAMMRDLESVLRAASDSTVRVVVLAARGTAFSAGVDVREHTKDKAADMIGAFNNLCRTLADLDVPTIAAITGPALGGGCEIVALCDIAIAAESATLGQPEISVGVFPPAAAAAFPLLFGKQGLPPILLGEPVSAARARDIGLVTQVVPDGDVEETVEKTVGVLSGLSAPVLRLAKRAARVVFRQQFRQGLEEAERIYLHELMATTDAHEGLEAFLARRPAVWRHR